ncbi:MAG: hypothetical protein ACAI25_01220, partial [Planctomycetota bacterium]
MIRRLLLSVLIVTSSGCGLAALIGVTTATVLVKDDKGGASTPRPVAVLTPAATSYDRVPISYILTGQGELDVLVEYSTTGSSGPFFAATEAQGAPSQGSTALSAGASGIPHVFVWNSFADLDPVSVSSSADVVVRIAAFQRTGGTPDPAATRVPFGERALTAPFAVDNRLVATIAGPPSTGGEGVEATAVPILAPEGAIVGSGLDLLVSDTGNARVRTLDAVTNLVTTLAGSSAGFGGDGGPAVAAALLQPRGIARATDGAVLICDAGNHRIRRVDPVTQLISTIAGTGSAGFAGDLGPATAARLSTPSAIVVHPSGAVLVADTGNHCVRAIDGSGIIRVVAGTGVAGATGDGGAATSAQLSSPRGLAVDAGGAVIVCDTGNHAVRRFTLGGSITTIAGALAQPGTAFVGLAATSARLSAPVGVVTIADLVYVSDTGNNRILRFRVDDKVERVAGSPTGVAGFAGDSGPASASLLAQPALLASDELGGLIVGDTGNNRIRRIDAGGLIATVVGSGSP